MSSPLSQFLPKMYQAPSAVEAASKGAQEALAVMALHTYAPAMVLATALAVLNAAEGFSAAAIDKTLEDPQGDLMSEEKDDEIDE